MTPLEILELYATMYIVGLVVGTVVAIVGPFLRIIRY